MLLHLRKRRRKRERRCEMMAGEQWEQWNATAGAVKAFFFLSLTRNLTKRLCPSSTRVDWLWMYILVWYEEEVKQLSSGLVTSNNWLLDDEDTCRVSTHPKCWHASEESDRFMRKGLIHPKISLFFICGHAVNQMTLNKESAVWEEREKGDKKKKGKEKVKSKITPQWIRTVVRVRRWK